MIRYEEYLEIKKEDDKIHELQMVGCCIEEIIHQLAANMAADKIRTYSPDWITVTVRNEPEGFRGKLTVTVSVDGDK